MPSYITSCVLEFSEDPLSDTTPTWQNVTNYLMGIEWWSGVDREGSDPQAGGATILLRNDNRDWEPDFEAGRFFPNITTQRRFRLTLNGVQEGLWYASGFDVSYPSQGNPLSFVTVSCGDGFEILSLDDLPGLDPPDADSYEDVVSFDEPWGYWRLGEPEGTKLVSHLRVSRKHAGKGKKRRKIKRRWRTEETRAEVAGVAGPSGTYKNTPSLGVPGAILGDPDTSVFFRRADFVAEHARISLDRTEINDGNKLSVEAWAKPVSLDATGDVRYVLSNDEVGINVPVFVLRQDTTDNWSFTVALVAGGRSTPTNAFTGVTVDVWAHLVGTWDGQTARLYIDGALVSESESAPGTLAQPDNDPAIMTIGLSNYVSNSDFDGYIDEVAVYETALTAGRVLAHYTAGTARGWPEQTAGTRIADIAAHALWSEAGIQVSGRTVQPAMKHGQAKLEEIAELAHAEGPRSLFFFNGAGDPVYLGHQFQETNANYNTVQHTFGDGPGEIGYDNIQLVYDNETFNDVTANKEGGDLVNVTDATAIADKGRRANTEWTDVVLAEDADVDHLANDILSFYKDPVLRPASITVNGAKALTQILDLDLGHMVRVRRRGEGGVPIDRVTRVLAKRKQLDVSKHLTCTYSLSRGFNGSDGYWHLGDQSFSNLGNSTVLA